MTYRPRYIDDRLVDRLVTYMIELDGRVIVIEHVPARVDEETGERYFAPETVERIQQIVREGRQPSRVIETPVFDFAA
jgi:YgiT-type zinc finger domain-containing protein